jgi:cytochrome c oxidase cbb3-type subunit 3
VSYPRNQYSHRQNTLTPPDAVSSASPYARHEKAPVLKNPTTQEKMGEALFQKNCAFCHAPDGTGKNWIGSFLEPHPRNLTDPENMREMSAERLRDTIRSGLPNTTMSAWKSVLNPSQIDSIVVYINKAFHPLKGIDGLRLDR